MTSLTITALPLPMEDTRDNETAPFPDIKPIEVKKPRGRPPMGAVLTKEGTYELPPEAVAAAAERLLSHRLACRTRYAATRKGLRTAKPELFKKTKRDDHCSRTLTNI